MIKIKKVYHLGLPVNDLDRATKFYTNFSIPKEITSSSSAQNKTVQVVERVELLERIELNG